MIRRICVLFGCFLIACHSFATSAEDTVRVTVKSSDEATFGVGFSVNGKVAGAIGKSYTGTGPKNQKYLFGYRKKAIYGKNISCGSMVLTQDSIITLTLKEDKCVISVK